VFDVIVCNICLFSTISQCLFYVGPVSRLCQFTCVVNLAVVMLIRKVVRFMFGARTLLVTNVVTSGAVMGLGDWIVQQTVEKTDVSEHKIDWARTRNYFSLAYLSVNSRCI